MRISRLILRLAFLVTACVFIAGCVQARSGSPRDHFLNSRTFDRVNYVELYPTSIEALRFHESEVLRTTESIVRGIRGESDGCTDISLRLDRIILAARAIHDHRTNRISELTGHFDAATDSIFFYQFRTKKEQEFGWMVVSGSKIKKKVVLGSGVVLPD